MDSTINDCGKKYSCGKWNKILKKNRNQYSISSIISDSDALIQKDKWDESETKR